MPALLYDTQLILHRELSLQRTSAVVFCEKRGLTRMALS